MRRTAAPLVVEALADEGVPFAFGIPGTHNLELYDALAAAGSTRPVLVTDEQSASFMADGLWRASGRLGCVNVVPGAGLTHALSGVAEAFLDNVPMLVLGCGIRRDSGRAFQLHDVDQLALVRPVVKAAFRVEKTGEAYRLIRDACRLARSGVPGPVFVEVPANLYMVGEDVPRTYREFVGQETPDRAAPSSLSREAEHALEILQRAGRPLLYLGAGAASAAARLTELAERLEAPVTTTFQGKGVFPETHPLFLWPGFGRAAPEFVRSIASRRGATLAIGCRFGEVGTASWGLEPPGSLVHVDIDPSVPGRNYQTRLAVQADAGAFVDALLAVLDQRRGESRGEEPGGEPGELGAHDLDLRTAIREGHESVWRTWLAPVGGPGVTPAHLLKCLQARLGPEAVFTTDSGNGTFLAVECLRLQSPGKYLAPVDFSCMGYAVPASLGAKLGSPDVPVVALAGDGAFLMTGLELLSAVREGVGVIVFVLRDGELAQIAQFQDTALGRRASSAVADYDLQALSKGMGVPFLILGSDDDVEAVVEEASSLAASNRPVIVEVAIDYSARTFFTRGVVKTSLLRLPLRDQVRFVGRALKRRVTG